MRRRGIMGAALVTAALASAGCGGGGGASSGGGHHAITGTLVTPASSLDIQAGPVPKKLGDPCESLYFQQNPNPEVLVKDAKGTIIAKTNVRGDGSWLKDPQGCVYRFSLTVPDADFYSFSVAGTSGPSFSKSELQQAGYKVGLSV